LLVEFFAHARGVPRGRHVKAGEHALYILEPCRYTVREKDGDTGEVKEASILRRFKAGARFGYEQTDGQALPEREAESRFIDGLPWSSSARQNRIRPVFNTPASKFAQRLEHRIPLVQLRRSSKIEASSAGISIIQGNAGHSGD